MKVLSLLVLLPALATAQRGVDPRVRSLTNGRSKVVFFFVAGCPHNPPGIKDVNAFQQMMGREYGVYGMTNLRQPDAQTYMKRLGARFPVTGDVDGKRIASFGAKHSLEVMLLGADGKIKRFSGGYNRDVLQKIADALPRKGTSDPKVKLNLEKFPRDLQSGCGFP